MTVEQALEAAGVRVRELEFDESSNGSLYASAPIGQGFEAFYSIWPHDAFDMWEAEFGVICHEFGGTTIWKGTGKENAVRAANAHNRARILAALEVAK